MRLRVQQGLHPLWRDLVDGLRSQPARAGLSFFAITVGILSLSLLVSVLDGLNEKARALVQDLGVQVLALVPPKAMEGEDQARLTTRQFGVLAANLPDCDVAPMRRMSIPLEGWSGQLTVVATDAMLARVRKWQMVAGRFLDQADVVHGQRHAVITSSLSRRMDWNVGSVMILYGTPLTVVGIVGSEAGSPDQESQDERLAPGDIAAFVPWSLTMSAASRSGGESEKLDAIFIRAPPEADLKRVQARAEGLLSAPDLRVADASWVSPETLLAEIRRLQRMMKWSLGGIAALCMLLGGTTLMSLMVANVRDRVAEIGLRRALGARAGDVALLFVLESGLITLAAAAAGGIAAFLVVTFAGASFPAPLKTGVATFMLPVLASLVMGALFSYWPASVAARISPAEALRNE